LQGSVAQIGEGAIGVFEPIAGHLGPNVGAARDFEKLGRVGASQIGH
jgi:hypothetical protein